MVSIYEDGVEKIVVCVTRWQKERLKTWCKMHHTTASQLVRDFIEELAIEMPELPRRRKVEFYGDKFKYYEDRNTADPVNDIKYNKPYAFAFWKKWWKNGDNGNGNGQH